MPALGQLLVQVNRSIELADVNEGFCCGGECKKFSTTITHFGQQFDRLVYISVYLLSYNNGFEPFSRTRQGLI